MRPLLPLVLLACDGKDAVDTATDISDQILAIDGVVSVEELEIVEGAEAARLFRVGFEQQVDHSNPDAGTFTQWLSLIHRDADAPMVVDTRGYGTSYSGHDNELSWLFNGNRMNIEHRFFVDSVPEPADYTLMTVTQAAADHHAIVTAFQDLYTGPWVATGASKGGETALFYRYFYPDDVVATVAYVAPVLEALGDPAFTDFFDRVGTPECRATLTTMQRTLLSYKDTLVPALEAAAAEAGETFTLMPASQAFEISVAELSWTFWQYQSDCASLPVDPTDVDAVWAWFLASAGPPFGYADATLSYFSPFFYQCANELGYPGLAYSEIADLLTVDPDDLTPLVPTDTLPTYNNEVVLAAAEHLMTEGETLMLIYGALDPWTERALTLSGASDSVQYLDADGNHGAGIFSLSGEDLGAAVGVLDRWVGVREDLGARVHRPRFERETDPRRR